MPRLTGLVKPRKSRKVTIGTIKVTIPARDEQCLCCKRYFRSVAHHKRTGAACKALRENVN